MTLNIPVILGTARKGRQSEKVANFVLAEVKDAGHESELIDVRDYRLEATDNTGGTELSIKLAEKVVRADAIIIVSPEYNHSCPGELKMMLDMLYKQYSGKPLGICGVSSGPLGGVRAVEALRLVAIEFSMVPVRDAVYFSKVQELFDEYGKISDEAYQKRVGKLVEGIAYFAKMTKV